MPENAALANFPTAPTATMPPSGSSCSCAPILKISPMPDGQGRGLVFAARGFREIFAITTKVCVMTQAELSLALRIASLFAIVSIQPCAANGDPGAGAIGSGDNRLGRIVDLQKIVDEEVDRAAGELRPQNIIAVLADPDTGEILAMASRSESAPDGEARSSGAISYRYEPSGTFKVVACAGFLEQGLGEENTEIFCENGKFQISERAVLDSEPYGNQTPLQILRTSSNIGAAKMALRLGTAGFYSAIRSFGFGRKTGIDLPGESEGALIPMDQCDESTLVRMSLGQAIAVTPIQIVMAYAAIANGGLLIQPSLALHPKSAPPRKTRILPEAVAAAIGKALKAEPDDQAGANAVYVAGKSGTSRAVDAMGAYKNDQFVTSFTGYFPADDPKCVCLVIVDRANVDPEINDGGRVAAPIFHKIADRTAGILAGAR